MKFSTWDVEADTWAHSVYISSNNNKDRVFMQAWYRYRHKKDGKAERTKESKP